MMIRRVALLAILPAIAIAAPKSSKKTTKKTPAKTDAPKDAPADAPTDTPKDDKPATTAAPPTAPAAPAGANGAGGGSGAGSGAPAEPQDKPEKPEKADKNEPDVDALRQEYLALRDELFKSRARANAVASQLYSTRIQIKLTYTTARFYNPAKASIRLDGANVFEDASGTIGGDDGVRFDGYVAPGRHLITFHVEATGKDDDSFTSTTETQIVVKAVAGKDLMVNARAKDSGDIAFEWKKSEHGNYGLGVDVSVKTGKLADVAPPPSKGGKK